VKPAHLAGFKTVHYCHADEKDKAYDENIIPDLVIQDLEELEDCFPNASERKVKDRPEAPPPNEAKSQIPQSREKTGPV
jgi:hypothetical protein